jgi:hypothetical protein
MGPTTACTTKARGQHYVLPIRSAPSTVITFLLFSFSQSILTLATKGSEKQLLWGFWARATQTSYKVWVHKTFTDGPRVGVLWHRAFQLYKDVKAMYTRGKPCSKCELWPFLVSTDLWRCWAWLPGSPMMGGRQWRHHSGVHQDVIPS